MVECVELDEPLGGSLPCSLRRLTQDVLLNDGGNVLIGPGLRLDVFLV